MRPAVKESGTKDSSLSSPIGLLSVPLAGQRKESGSSGRLKGLVRQSGSSERLKESGSSGKEGSGSQEASGCQRNLILQVCQRHQATSKSPKPESISGNPVSSGITVPGSAGWYRFFFRFIQGYGVQEGSEVDILRFAAVGSSPKSG
jgi:hypothetical protein